MAAKKKVVQPTKEENLVHWDFLERTDPAYTKKFNAGRFKGTDINATYRMRHLTERFGPAGKGFGFDIGQPIFYGEGDLRAVTISAALWWMEDGTKHTAPEHYGGTKLYLTAKGKVTGVDEDAVKKAVTDAMGKAALALGAHADVYMGLHDDSKYLADIKQEIRDEEDGVEEPEPSHNIAEGDMDGDLEDDAEWDEWLQDVHHDLSVVANPTAFRKWSRKEKENFSTVKMANRPIWEKAMTDMLDARLRVGMMSDSEHEEAMADLKGK
jgi:hypothetical protein